MHIAVDYQIFLSQKYGGISRYHVELGKELVNLGCHIDFISPLFINEYLEEVSQQTISLKKLQKLPPYSTRLLRGINNLFFSGIVKATKPDIIHNTYYRKPNFQDKNIPTVLTIHDMIHELYPESFSPKDNTVEIKKRAINRADHIICISKNTYTDLLSIYDIPESKVSIVYHGFNNITTPEVTSTSLVTEKPYILYVGSRKGYKNFNALFVAYSISKRIKKDFDIVCFGGGKFSESELLEFKKAGLEDRIHFEFGDDTHLSMYYKNARVFVYPSIYEGFGMPPLEAMANNCPVVASNSSSVPEIVGDAGKYFDPGEVESLLYAMEEVAFHEDEITKLIMAGIKNLGRFSWDKCAKQTKEVYQHLI